MQATTDTKALSINEIYSLMPNPNLHKDEKANFTILQLFTPCLAEMCYFIVSDGEAAIIDPLREVAPYMELIKSYGVTLKYILETHFHADFLGGHYDLSKKTGATVVYGPTAQADFDIKVAQDGEVLPLGKIGIRLIHTPGHTVESSCYVLVDGGKDYCIFTGDTLFLGEVGRPDLACKTNEITKEDLAGFLFDSLRNKVMTLDPELIVYPGHGAGSSCGKKIGSGTFCTLGRQMQNNYALQPMTKEEFVQQVAGDLPRPPAYFFHDAVLNKMKVEGVDEILERSLHYMDLDEAL